VKEEGKKALVLYGQKSIEAVAAEREKKKSGRYWYESNQIFIGGK